MAAGDILNLGSTFLVVISADGACRVLKTVDQRTDLLMCLAQPLQSNIRCACIADVDGDGSQELLVALTDRVVRTYRYTADPNNPAENSGYLVAMNKWECPALITAFSAFVHPGEKAGVRVVLSQSSRRYVVVEPRLGVEREPTDPTSVDRSIRYCEAAVSERITSSRDSGNGVVFVAKKCGSICLFHQTADGIALIDEEYDARDDESYTTLAMVWLPSHIFSMSSVTIVKPRSDNNQVKRRLMVGCDWRGTVYAFDPNAVGDGQVSRDVLVMNTCNGNVSCFAAGCGIGRNSSTSNNPTLFVAVGRTRGKVLLYDLPYCQLFSEM